MPSLCGGVFGTRGLVALDARSDEAGRKEVGDPSHASGFAGGGEHEASLPDNLRVLRKLDRV